MSQDTHASAPAVPQPQDEQLPIGKLVAVALISLVAFALGILWAVQIMVSERDSVATVSAPATYVGQPEIGMVDQQLYEVEQRAVKLAAAKAERLNAYGWVSRKDQIIHVPIAEAMKAVVAGKRLARPTAPGILPAPAAPIPGVPTDGGVPPAPDAGTVPNL